MISSVHNNLLASFSNRQLGINTKSYRKTTERLSSGYKVNRSADDACGLAISEKMRRQIRGVSQAKFNAQDGISLVQIADGAMQEVHEVLQRCNELAVKAANDTNSSTDRQYIQDEIDELKKEVIRIRQTTKFNETPVLLGNGKPQPSGTAGGMNTNGTAGILPLDGADFEIVLQTGNDNHDSNKLRLDLPDLKELKVGSIDVTTPESAAEALDVLNKDMSYINRSRSRMGSFQNQLEHTINNLDSVYEETQSSESCIRDTDMSKTVVEHSNLNIVRQAGHSILAQANQTPRGITTMLGE